MVILHNFPVTLEVKDGALLITTEGPGGLNVTLTLDRQCARGIRDYISAFLDSTPAVPDLANTTEAP